MDRLIQWSIQSYVSQFQHEDVGIFSATSIATHMVPLCIHLNPFLGSFAIIYKSLIALFTVHSKDLMRTL